MDQIQSQLDSLTELSDDEITELESDVVSAFEQLENEPPTPQSVDEMSNLADALDAIRGEVTRRAAQAEELAARAADAVARVYGDVAGADGSATSDGDADDDDDSDDSDDSDDDGDPMTAAAESTEIAGEVAELSDVAAPVETEAVTELSAEEEVAPEEGVTASAEETPEAEAATEEVPAEAAELSTEEVAEVETPEEEGAAPAELSTEEIVAEEATPVEAELSAETPVEAEASANIEENTSEQTAQEEAPVTASAEESFEAPADRRPVVEVTKAPVAITAGADIPGYSAGTEISDMDGVAELFVKRLDSLRHVNGGDGQQHTVANIRRQYPESRQLTMDAQSNWNKIQDVVGPEALMASGGHATPVEVLYQIYGLGSTERPVRDALPSFQADRGGIRYVTPPVLSAYTGATGVWTNTTDITPGGSTKASLTVTGASENVVVTDAITLQLQFGNFFARAYPELVARHNELALIQQARQAELNLLSKINSYSLAVVTNSLIGVARDFLAQLKRAGAAYRSRQRIDVNTQLTAIVPTWLIDAIAADLALAMPGDQTWGVSVAQINAALETANITLVASPDQNSFGAQSGSGATLLPFPTSFTWYLFAEGTFLFLDGGTLDLGIIRDSTLVSTNDYKMFVESFEGLAMLGVESLAITSTIAVDGAAAALRDTTGGATAAATNY